MKKRIILVVSLAICLVMLSGCTALPYLGLQSMFRGDSVRNTQSSLPEAGGELVTISREEYERYQKYNTLMEIMAIVEENYYEDTDEHSMLDGAAMGMLSAIGDPYTFYYTAEEYASMWEDDEGEYAGVGILISADYTTGICTAIRVFTGSPAEKAGVLRGDILYMVEDMYVTADNLNDAVEIMRGTPGTDVNVTFLRNGEERKTVMTRAVVNVNRVESTVLEGDIGYIYLIITVGIAYYNQTFGTVSPRQSPGQIHMIGVIENNYIKHLGIEIEVVVGLIISRSPSSKMLHQRGN